MIKRQLTIGLQRSGRPFIRCLSLRQRVQQHQSYTVLPDVNAIEWRESGASEAWMGHCITEFLTVLRSIQVPHRTACSFSITREHKYKLYKPQCSSNVRKMFL